MPNTDTVSVLRLYPVAKAGHWFPRKRRREGWGTDVEAGRCTASKVSGIA